MKASIVHFTFLIAVTIGSGLAVPDVNKDDDGLAQRQLELVRGRCAVGIYRASREVSSVYYKTPPSTHDLKGDALWDTMKRASDIFNELRAIVAKEARIVPSTEFTTLSGNHPIPCNKEIAQRAFKTSNDAIKILLAINSTRLD